MSSRDAAYFESLYAQNPDPWDFETSHYEREKYADTIAALGGRHFAYGFEAGCSIGVLTRQLAASCDALLAVDIAETALAQARHRCADLTHVRFENRRLPQDWPPVSRQKFDLVVLSEVLYFLAPADIGRLASLACASMTVSACVLLVNYTDPIDEPCNGHEAAEVFIAASAGRLSQVSCLTRDRYRIDLLKSF
jgi:predicted TPR repeat methyltransferase